MTVTYNIGDRVMIDWNKVDQTKLYELEVDRFTFGEVYIGTVKEINGEFLTIIWDRKYHSFMYGRYGKQWNLRIDILKLADGHKELTQEEKILLRIKRIYAKAKLPFVRNWSK